MKIDIRAARQAQGLSQTMLAQVSGVPQGLISGIESGNTKNPRVDTIFKIATALGCTIDELLSDTQDTPSRLGNQTLVRDVRDMMEEER